MDISDLHKLAPAKTEECKSLKQTLKLC